MIQGMNQNKERLMRRLGGMGVEEGSILEYMLSLKSLLLVKPGMDNHQINSRLNALGWHGFCLDNQTMKLAIACFDAEGGHNC